MILHVDANAFYASCEKIFRPDLKNKPVVVLSNNDGIVVALSAESKDIGLRRGDAYFKVKSVCACHEVAVFSSNYELYADFSNRLNSIYAMFCEKLEVYSIDESFLFLPAMASHDYTEFGYFLRNLVFGNLGIWVSVGIAPTKTLAKMCNKKAKKGGSKPGDAIGVFNWMECNQEEVLRSYRIEEVWNIGEKKSQLLRRYNYRTAWDLRNMELSKAKKYLTVTGFNTVMELNGKNVIDYIAERRLSQNICNSRSFSKEVYDKNEIRTALSVFCTNAVSKMLGEDQCCGALYVTLGTAYPFNVEFDPEIHYYAGDYAEFAEPTNYLPDILKKVEEILDRIYEPNYGYRKASVTLLKLQPCYRGPLLFETKESETLRKKDKVMTSIEHINGRFGKFTLMVGTGIGKKDKKEDSWVLKREFKSPNYTTDLNELPVAR